MPPIKSGDADAGWADLVAQTLDQAVWVFDTAALRTVYANTPFRAFWGDRIDRMMAGPPGQWLKLLHPEDRKRARADFSAPLDSGLATEYRVLQEGGGHRWVSLRVRTIASPAHGDRRLMVGISEDITERKRREIQMQERELQLRAALRAANLDAWRYEVARDEFMLSDDARLLFDVPPGGRIDYAALLTLIHPADRAQLDAEWRRFRTAGDHLEHSYRTVARDGTIRWIETICTVIRNRNGSPRTVLGVSLDVSKYKHQALALETALQQKEVLLREVNHRIKNSLQIISTLLMVQATSVRNRQAKALFDAAAARVHAVCRVHERLYRLPAADRVALGDFLRHLIGDLGETGLFDAAPMLEARIDDAISVGMDDAISIGLILNEVLTNAAKYGRSADGFCRVRLTLERQEGGILLTVADDGPGLPERPGRGGIGIMIVETLAASLRARLEIGTGPGTRMTLHIPQPAVPATMLH